LDTEIKYIAVCLAGIAEDYNDVLVNAFYSLADSFGYKLLFFNSFSSLYYFEKHDIGESNIFHLMNYERLDGIIMLSETIKHDDVRNEIVEQAKRYKVPVISIDHYIEGCYNINFQYEKAMEAIVTHLIEEHGYTRINFIAGLPDNKFSDERLEAYKRVLESHGIPVEEGRIGYGGFWSVPTEKVIDDFLSSSLEFPEAIVCANDAMAIAAVKFLTMAGYRIPDDIAVTGFDGIPEALEHLPKITTAKHDYYTAAQSAFALLKKYFQGEQIPAQSWVDSVFVEGGSCGCNVGDDGMYSTLVRNLYERLDDYNRFSRDQIAMTADLTDNDSFQGVFDNLMKYSDNFCSDKFWLCIVDDFLSQKEVLADIIKESVFKRMGYSSTMDVMLSRINGEWMGMTDFSTSLMLPKLDEVLKAENNIMFFPLHALEQTIGYVALVYHPKKMRMTYAYQFFMNISNALETTRTHQRQQAVINSLENKYVHDPMTGLFNRRGFYQRLQTVFQNCVEKSGLLMVVSVDLNGLKQINDTYGHADGDIAISTIGRALADVASDKITCARFGGDEFIAAGQVNTEEEAEQFCQDIVRYLGEFNAQSGKPYEVSASIGRISGVPNKNITLDEFIKIADEKMYEDKVRYHSRRR
jgi:diguanylate cyclase (GGDEF)-like protein